MTRPLVEVVTRHWPTPRRAGLLVRQQASLMALPHADYVQTLLLDPQGRGIGASHKRLRDVTPHGQFLWVLDDDDLASTQDVFGALRAVSPGTDFVMMRMLHHEYGLLPADEHWQRRPFLGKVGPACVFIGAHLWLRARWAWSEEYAGDFAFIRAAYDLADEVAWVDCVAAEIPAVSRGAA